jgi:hypothetical protein
MPAVGKQEFKARRVLCRATADIDPEYRAQVAAYTHRGGEKGEAGLGRLLQRQPPASRPSPIRTACSATRN